MRTRLEAVLLISLLACKPEPGGGDDTATLDPCDGSLETYCASHTCNALSTGGTCDTQSGQFRVVERCGDEGTAWMTWSGDSYLFAHTRRFYDATGTLVGVRFTEDYEGECGDFSTVWGTIPTCEAWCTWEECNSVEQNPPACVGGASPPG